MRRLKLSNDVLKGLINEPEQAITELGLYYAYATDLTIERIVKGKNFSYLEKNIPLSSDQHIKRINELVIPPAWKEVRIAKKENAHLQAIGRDKKRRKQYIYHPVWQKIKNQTKFYRLAEFGKCLPTLRAKVDRDLGQGRWSKSKTVALVIRLMEETHIRIGNDYYAKRNKTYGLTTLRTRHLHLEKDKIKFNFVGKKGKEHSVTLRNKRLRKLVLQSEELPGWELFKFFDVNGNKHYIESGMVNEYVREVTNRNYSAKDFRTWAGSIICLENLLDFREEEDEKKIEKNIISAIDETAKELGNTRTVCKKYYIHPVVLSAYQNGRLRNLEENTSLENSELLSNTETLLLGLIEEYQPIIIK